ncbi:MAG: PBP1A family penicillin-binding protein [Xenococcaceae cyanobacterium MO_188.B19]|nr:PBP1A family penicillin-binding protein [Xenococcaceae cyanobacterium MO_188.B19]
MKPTNHSNSSLDLLAQIEQKGQKQHKKLKWLSLGLGLLVGMGSSAGGLFWLQKKITATIPESVSDVVTYVRPNTVTIKAIDGTIIKQIGAVSHEKIKLDEIPPIVHQAFVASEDKRFYQHSGVDFQGVLRAAWSNLKAGGVVEGGSTITQQLSRIVYLDQEKSIWRKLKEMEIARQIEQNLGKKEILETYLNLVYLGSGSYGVQDAAWVYFGKTAENLTVAEIATLVGIVPAPSIYSPLSNPDLALKQRNTVLKRMEEIGYITPEVAQAAIASPIVTNPKQPKRLQRQAQYFTNYIEEELPKYISEEALQAGGIVVETTIDLRWQAAAEKTVISALDSYGKWQKFQQASLVALDSRTGGIKAMVGGRDFGDNQYNRVTQAQRQPGSTFKTFVYTAALAAGFSPYKTYLDAELFVDGYQPRNYKEKYRETNVSLYNALTSSINTIALQTSLDVGWNPIIKIAHNMGIESEMQPTYSLALGSWEVNLLELTNAYATLANKGVYEKAHGITKISDRHGEVIYEADFPSVKAIETDTAAMMTWMLQGVVRSGTGIPAQIGRPSAGKTGTSDEARDLWYVGYIPQVTTGVWLGNDDNKPTKGTSGAAAQMWRKFMLEVVKDIPVEGFPARPRLTGRKAAIALEPVKPKRKYYIRKAKPKAKPRYVRSRRKYYPSRRKKRTSPTTSANRSKPLSPKTSPVANPASSSTSPTFSKPIKSTPATKKPERDWVKERLGRQ